MQFHFYLIYIMILIGLPGAQYPSSSQHRGVITNIVISQMKKWKSKFSKPLKCMDKVSWQSDSHYGGSGNQIQVSHSLSSTQITGPKSAFSGMVLLLLQYKIILTKTIWCYWVLSSMDLRTVPSHFHSEVSNMYSFEHSKWSHVCVFANNSQLISFPRYISAFSSHLLLVSSHHHKVIQNQHIGIRIIWSSGWEDNEVCGHFHRASEWHDRRPGADNGAPYSARSWINFASHGSKVFNLFSLFFAGEKKK